MTRIAVLGLGSIGMRHAGNLKALGAEVIGYDPDPQRRALLSEMGEAVTLSQEEALARAQAVVIASPNLCHAQDLGACIKAHLPCFIEKPLAHDVEPVAALIEEAGRQGLLIFPGLNLRFHPAVVAAKCWQEEGRLGKLLWGRAQASLFLPDYRPRSDYRLSYSSDPRSGGVIFDDIHEIDLICHLMGPGRLLAATAGNSGTLGIEAEDMADLSLMHECNARSTIHLDFVTRPRLRRTEIAGTEGRLSIDLDERRATLVTDSGEVLRDERFSGSYADDHKAQIGCFLECLRTASPPPCSPQEALHVLSLVLDARHVCGLPTP